MKYRQLHIYIPHVNPKCFKEFCDICDFTASKKKQKKQKGKTLALTDFLADDKGGSGPGTSYVLASKPLDWASEMENMDNTDGMCSLMKWISKYFISWVNIIFDILR